ncbi:nuclease-related domain-containing protein [Planococcus liqunii]|uniref:Nuclease-related domain-containing protein n=1 Tax=Planococcus liqunii TaxID=3058394 RepID=A0ABT8MP02_9BACL|nr:MULTISPECIES: nuclease-related domain-containing protein [unclassified Planococcus (in: firmicutes)]MDN7226598.1 nuclease-related domain-containing protein [Planococcus sp. N064]WKA50376.1 nuclease-related domain-containing protein [Planococcus sp. N056]
MILKKRSEPPEIFQLESLLQRIPFNHSQFPHWTEKLRRITAGFHGEQRVDSFWQEITLPIPHYLIHDLFIKKKHSTHQMDTILVTSRFILVLEIKSISGLLHFDQQTRQFSRTNKDGSIDGMRNPDDQVRRHEKWLEQFLTERKLDLPVIGAIVFAYPSAVIQSKAGNRIVIQSSGLPHLLDELLASYQQDILSKALTKKLAVQLLKLHSIKQLPELILPPDYFRGVFCPKCQKGQLHYYWRKWACKSCSFSDPAAYLTAIEQYRVLCGPTITNRQFRDFIDLKDPAVTSKLLKDAKMPFEGSYKDRVYLIPGKNRGTESNSIDFESI